MALQAQQELAKKNPNVRVVSLPSFELFLKQDQSYQEKVLPSAIRKRVAVEMASTYDWAQSTGLDGAVIGIDHFGESGNGDELTKKSVFTAAYLVQTYLKICEKTDLC